MQEQESHPTQQRITITNEQDIKRLLTSTFKASTQLQSKQSQTILLQSLNSIGFIQKLTKIIHNNNPQQQDIIKAAANLIKIYSYDHANDQGDKSTFIQIVYNLIMIDKLQVKTKQILGGALEYQFNQDQKYIYKNIVKQKILQIIYTQQGIIKFDSCIIVLLAYFNSIQNQPQQMVEFINQIIQPISSKVLHIYQIISKMLNDIWLINQKKIISQLILFFQFLQRIFSNLIQEQQDLKESINIIRKNQYLINLMQTYLILFHNNNSIISQIHPLVNQIKGTITNIIKLLYRDTQCPQKMFHTLFFTILLQAKEIVHDIQIENVLINCMNILQHQLQKKFYINIFQMNRMQLIFSLFMYSVSNNQQQQTMQKQPLNFAQLAQQYTQGSIQTQHLKVSAAELLRILVQKIDEGLRISLQIALYVMSESIGVEDMQSQHNQCIRQQFSRYSFYLMKTQQKLQTSLMILSALSTYINKRPEINKSIYGFFIANFNILLKIQSPIVILRLIRTISYFPSALYFIYIQSQMNRGKIFQIQGIKAFERILRTNKFQQLFQFLSSLFIKIIQVLKIQDPLMQLIIINNYEKMIKINYGLYQACILKIKIQFFKNMNINQHSTMISFNLLYSLIKKQKDITILPLIQKIFYQISNFLQQEKQIKLIEIYQVILEKSINIKQQVQKFAIYSLKNLSSQQKGTLIFKFYNNFLKKIDGKAYKFNHFFTSFWQETIKRYQLYKKGQASIQVIGYYCFLMSEIIANNCQIYFNQEDIKKLMEIAENIPKSQKQYPIIVLLTYLYMKPLLVVDFLKKYNIYQQFLNGITKIQYDGGIIKKIYNLSYIVLLQVQKNHVFIRQIIIQCIKNLKELNKQSRKRLENSPIFEVKARRFQIERVPNHGSQQESMKLLMEDRDDNQLVNMFVKFKHPFEDLSQFDQFKMKFWMNDHLVKDLDAQTKIDLKSIIQTEMIDRSKLRIIKKVRRQ